MNKKLLVVLGIVAVAVYVKRDSIFGKRKEDETQPIRATDNFTPRLLTDAEALSYLNSNNDLLEAFGKGNIEKAKEHFLNQGYKENRIM